MSRTLTRPAIAVLALAASLLATSAGATTPDAKTILTQALTDGARQTSMKMSGTVSGSGITMNLDGGFSLAGSGGATTESGVGTEYVVEPTDASYCFVKASSLAVLKSVLEVRSPTSSEIGVWYKVPTSDPRYVSIAAPNSAQTVAQLFSFSPVGWSRAAKYEGTTVLKGVHVIKLSAASNAFVTGSGFGPTTLYVTNTARPLPFAMSGPVGTTGVFYFSKWGATKVTYPTASTELPR